MNVRAQGELAVGLLGIWAMLQALSVLSTTASMMLSMDRQAMLTPVLAAIALPAVLMLGIGYFVVRNSATVVRLLFPTLGGEAETDPMELSVVLVGCVGLWLLGSAVPGMVRTLLLNAAVVGLGFPAPRARDQRAAVGSVVQGMFGLVLVLRPRSVISLWRT